ncbi:hypothetical protein AB2N04_16495 [Nitratireductor sp. GISD-1A_MAKvit]|uniref:hypothetical protein n=1 Tax=Nitratireductor sp. GISD-1A_MAKvit TaxID=3234198 RepID=UPI00346750C2
MFSALRLRHRTRDEETDRWRINRLFQTMETCELGLQAEKRRLEKRRENVAATAAFAQARCENGTLEVALSTQVEEMTCILKVYSDRLESLQRQIDLIRCLRQAAQTRADMNDPIPAADQVRTVRQ